MRFTSPTVSLTPQHHDTTGPCIVRFYLSDCSLHLVDARGNLPRLTLTGAKRPHLKPRKRGREIVVELLQLHGEGSLYPMCRSLYCPLSDGGVGQPWIQMTYSSKFSFKTKGLGRVTRERLEEEKAAFCGGDIQ